MAGTQKTTTDGGVVLMTCSARGDPAEMSDTHDEEAKVMHGNQRDARDEASWYESQR